MCGSKPRLDSEDIHVYPDRTEAIGCSDSRGLSDALISLSDLPSRAAISCADRCRRGEGGARASRQAAAIHKCGVLPMLSVSAAPVYSIMHM
jgi:hypothetical protein